MKIVNKYPWKSVCVTVGVLMLISLIGFKEGAGQFLMSLVLLVSILTGIGSAMNIYSSCKTNEWVLEGYGKIWDTVLFLAFMPLVLHWISNYEWWLTSIMVTGFTLEYIHYGIAWYKTTFKEDH